MLSRIPTDCVTEGVHETLGTVRWSEGSPSAYLRRARGVLSRSLRRRTEAARAPLTSGLPAGLSFPTLDRICRDWLDDALESCSHRHLSAWKPQGAFRLFLRTASGREGTLIYKETIATPEFNPILDRLPVVPGPPEYTIYRCETPQLAAHLPRCLLAEELEPGHRYCFIYEDLDTALANDRDRVPPVRALSELHTALGTCHGRPSQDLLLRYLGVSDEMFEYYRGSLEIHLQRDPDRILKRLLDQFDDIAAMAGNQPEPPPASIGIVHGDPNLSNVKFTVGDQVKFLDWEWAGIHIRHVDLAAMLKFVTPATERRALALYASLVPSISPPEHRQLYFRCKLDRSLLDMSLMSALVIRPAPRRLDVGSFLHRSARAALHAFAQLQRST